MAQMDHYIRAGDQVRMDVPHARLSRSVRRRRRPAADDDDRTAVRPRRPVSARAMERATLPGGYEERRAEHRSMIDAAAAGDAELTAERLAVHYAAHGASSWSASSTPGHDLPRCAPRSRPQHPTRSIGFPASSSRPAKIDAVASRGTSAAALQRVNRRSICLRQGRGREPGRRAVGNAAYGQSVPNTTWLERRRRASVEPARSLLFESPVS